MENEYKSENSQVTSTKGSTIRKRILNISSDKLSVEKEMVPKINVLVDDVDDGESMYSDSETAHLIKHKTKKTVLPEVVSNGTLMNCSLTRDQNDFDEHLTPMLPSSSEEQEDDLRTTIVDKPDIEEETSFSIALQVIFPFFIAGFGTVSAGLLLDFVQVRFCKLRDQFLLIYASKLLTWRRTEI